MNRAKYPREKPIMLILDYPVQNEIDRDLAYSSASSLDMLGMLARSGLRQQDMAMTYLSYERPGKENFDWSNSFVKFKQTVDSPIAYSEVPYIKDCFMEESLYEDFQGLVKEIQEVKPKLILVAGKWSFMLLTGLFTLAKTKGTAKDRKPLGGLATYRASICKAEPSLELPETIIYPVYPSLVKYRMPELTPIIQWDYRKAGEIFKKLDSGEKKVNDYLTLTFDCILGTSTDVVSSYLTGLEALLEEKEVPVSVDIETRHYTIDCFSICYEDGRAICIPFSTLDSPSFWPEDEELELILRLSKIFKHPNFKLEGQNFSYDAQYFWKYWLLHLETDFDTMIGNHILYNNQRKSLDMLASVYCEEYQFWKDMQNHSMESMSK